MNRLASLAIRWRWPIIVAFVATTAVFGSRLPSVEIEPRVKEMLPKDVPSVLNLDAIEALFGGTEMIMAVITADDILDANIDD